MTSNLQYYFNFSDDVRNSCVEGNIIEKDQELLTFEDCEKIVEYFGGTFTSITDNQTPSIQKLSDSEFEIKCSPNDNSLDIIHELAHAFLHFNDMEVNESYSCLGTKYQDVEACVFSRAFIMPESLFTKVVFENVTNGLCDLLKVAKTFGVEYIQADLRGKELNIWE